MVAGIELGKQYAQVCVKTDSMKDAESVTKVAGTEHYRLPVEVNIENKNELQELFRKLWKMLAPYGNKDSLSYLVFCLEENSEKMREMLLDIVQIYNISTEKVCFLDKSESFCAYVLHQSAELLSHNALLIENREGKKEKFLLHKRTKTTPQVLEVREVSEKSLESIFTDHAISSVFLVGDDFEEEWMQKNLKLLKTGRRVFMGKNLYVKGACYRGLELKENHQSYLYLGEEKVDANIGLKAEVDGKAAYTVIAEGGKNWYESNVSVEVLLLDEPVLEFVMVPINGREKKTAVIHLENLPARPKKTTRLRIELEFLDPSHAKLMIKDLGFGEIFPQSDMVYEGELQWD
ncbi:MAG: hypothetical protein IJ024_01220 [Lachnospiraceae bacterium]|nr:hypothetical protein [Lachnospiraceae bacterium]